MAKKGKGVEKKVKKGKASINHFFKKKPKPATSEDTSQQHGTNAVTSGDNPSDVNMNESGGDVIVGNPETNSSNPSSDNVEQNGEEEGMFDAANLLSLVGDENNYSESGALISASPEQKHIVTSMAIAGISHRSIMGAVVQVCSVANVDFSAASAPEKAVLIERAGDHLRATHGLVVESQLIDGGARMDGDGGEAVLRGVINEEGCASYEDALRGPAVMAVKIICDQLLGSVGFHDKALGEKLMKKVELSIGLTHSAHFGVDNPRPGVDAVVDTLAKSNLAFDDLQIITTGMMDMNLQAESLRQPFPPPAQLAEVEDTPRPVVIENYNPHEQFPPSLHDKVVSKAIRATRDKLLEKYGPVAVAILAKAFAVSGEDIFEFHRQRLLSVLQGSEDTEDMDTQEVLDICWRIMEAGAFLSSEQLATVHDPEPNRANKISLPTRAAAILFHCLGKHMALSRLTDQSLRLLSDWFKPGTYYRNEDGGRFNTCGVRMICDTLVTYTGGDSRTWHGNIGSYKNGSGDVADANKTEGVYRRPTSDEISYIISQLIPALVQVQDGETIGHYYTGDNDPFVTFQSSGGIVLRVAIAVKIHRNVSPSTRKELKGAKSHNAEGVKGDLIGDIHCIEFTNISMDSWCYVQFSPCNRKLVLHRQVGNCKLFHFKGFKKDVAETEHMAGIRSCYLADYLEPLGHGRENSDPHRTDPGRFLDPDSGERGNALHSAPMGYVARKVAGGPREVDNLPSAQVREGHPWYQLYLDWCAARSA